MLFRPPPEALPGKRMSDQPSDTSSSCTVPGFTDPQNPSEEGETQIHTQEDTVPQEVIEEVRSIGDMVVLCLTDEQGRILLRKLTETCPWKPPLKPVPDNSEYTELAVSLAEDELPFPVQITSIGGIWRFELEANDGPGTVAQNFVIFESSPSSSEYQTETSDSETDKKLADVSWFDEIPETAEDVPGVEEVW